MYKKFLLPLFLIATTVTATAVATEAVSVKNVEQAPEEQFPLKLLNTAKRARLKLQLKQDAGAELKTIISTKKNIEAMHLKSAADFAGQQAALTSRNADSATLTAFESQRQKMNQRFNELIRLINQIDRNQKTALLPEKLDELIKFLEPNALSKPSDTASKTPEKLSRGSAPVRQKKSIR